MDNTAAVGIEHTKRDLKYQYKTIEDQLTAIRLNDSAREMQVKRSQNYENYDLVAGKLCYVLRKLRSIFFNSISMLLIIKILAVELLVFHVCT